MDQSSTIDYKLCIKIAIIGGGISGLAAASNLIHSAQPGYHIDVTIFEAGCRLGGRIRSVPLNGNSTNSPVIDIGAQWLHGISANPLYPLAKAQGLVPENKGKEVETSIFLKSKSVLASLYTKMDISEELFDRLQKIYGRICSEFTSDASANLVKKYEDSYGAFVSTEYFKEVRSLNLSPEENHLAQLTFKHFSLLQCFHEGCSDLRDVSLISEMSYPEGEGHVQIPTGFSSLLTTMINGLNNHGQERRSCNIRFQTHVLNVRIKWSDYKVFLEVSNSDSEAKGSIFVEVFDHVIVTSSLGVLQRHHRTMFTHPSLPAKKVAAIEALRFGVVEKVFLEFTERVIPHNKLDIQYIVDRSRLSDGETCGEEVELWYSIGSSGRVLMGVVCEDSALRRIDKIPDNEMGRRFHACLERVLKRTLPPLKSVTRSEWHTDPFICGSYTYCPRNVSLSAFQDLADPILDSKMQTPLVLFAGEHTHPTQYASTHGAYMSGIREAQRLISHISHINKSDPTLMQKL